MVGPPSRGRPAPPDRFGAESGQPWLLAR